MKEKIYYGVVSFIFTLIAVIHLVRIVDGWDFIAFGGVLPIWASWAAVIIAGYMAVRGLQLYRKQ